MNDAERLQLLSALVGKWRTEITALNADGSEGGKSVASDIYAWSANGKFLQHDVDAEMDGERLQSVEMIALNPSGSGYVTRSYDPDGTFNDFSAALAGRRWTLIGELQRFNGKFSDDGQTLSGEWEARTSQSTNWSPLMRVTLRRLR